MPLDHYVSQVHLKRFYAESLGNRKMHAYRKSDGQQFPCGSEDVCRIKDGSTNDFLGEPRLVEEFLKTIEPKYNAACAALAAGTFDQEHVYVITGFIAYVASCSPTAVRLGTRHLEALVHAEAAIMDQADLLPPSPPELGGASFSELLSDGRVVIETDRRFPHALGISNLLHLAAAFGNTYWEILLNDDASSPFFTSDFPVAIEANPQSLVVNRVIPLTPSLALRIHPRTHLSMSEPSLSFENLRYKVRNLGRQGVRLVNTAVVRSAENQVFASINSQWVSRFVAKHSRYRVEISNRYSPHGSGIIKTSSLEVRGSGGHSD
ncbi:DUF4238 domain-containing protein [Croceicoccus mobilis]|uniref:DUF4238 domain-containing protein n=1 Tax=Croceicoccus mobilis TaxID=1703339 RepID=A0A916Z6E0_9SPHN|nr:hypothetical protein GCM10010990_30770 [Croceicoccus mobilis]